MKGILTILLFLPLLSLAQIKVGGVKIAPPVPPPSTPTTFWYLDFTNQYGCGSDAFFHLCGTDANISTAGNVPFSGIAPQVGSGGDLAFINGSGFYGSYDVFSPPEVGQPANSGLFSDVVIGFGWRFSNGASFTISGLTIGQTYTMYFLSNQPNYEAATVSFSIQGVTSAQINNSNNFGSSTTSPWYTDPALVSVTFTASATSATVFCNVISGPWGSINLAVLTK